MATGNSADSDKRDVVQVNNPKAEHHVKIDRRTGKIISPKVGRAL